MQARLGGDGFEVVALNIDRNGLKKAKAFYEKLGIKALALYGDKARRATGAFRIIGMPTTLLLDRKGREIGRLVGPAEWDSEETVRLIEAAIAAQG